MTGRQEAISTITALEIPGTRLSSVVVSAPIHKVIPRALTIELVCAIGFALARFAICWYRAVHQSIVLDEAYTYQHYVSVPWTVFFHSQYYSNNHVLFSILARFSVLFFGLSELTLRLPTLLAGLALTLGEFWILRELTSSTLTRWGVLLVLSLNPLLLDFSVAARGYGLGLALFVWAAYLSLKGRHLSTGLLLGLAVAANLTMAFPALGLMAAVTLLEDFSIKDQGKALMTMFTGALVVFLSICYPILRTAGAQSFRVGYESPGDSLMSLISPGTGAPVVLRNAGPEIVIETAIVVMIGVFILAVAAFAFVGSSERRIRLVPAFTLILTCLGLSAAHNLFGVLYPIDRTGLYLVVLFALAWGTCADSLNTSRWRSVPVGLLFVLAVLFATQFTMRNFEIYRFDRDTKKIALLLKQACEGRSDGSVSVSANWVHQPALEFYREYLRITPLKHIAWQINPELSGYDFYVLSGPDARRGEETGLRALFSDTEAGVIWAANP